MTSITSFEFSGPFLTVHFHTPSGSEDNSVYFAIWLRENCRCPNCYLQSSNQRVYVLSHENLASLTIKSVEVLHHQEASEKEKKNNGSEDHQTISRSHSQLRVEYSDGHISHFDAYWLWQRGWDSKLGSTRYEAQDKKNLEKIYWSQEDLKSTGIDSYEFEEVMKSEDQLFKWCQSLIRYGLVLLKNVPTELGQVRQFAKRIAFLEASNYGETFCVASKKNPSNLAYTDIPLLCHNDLPFLEISPGVQLLHCIKQAQQGGSNPFCDAFRIASDMKKNEATKKYYETLSNVELSYWNCANDWIGDFHYRSAHTLIEHDSSGEITCINFNHVVRDSIFNLPADQMKDYYEAYLYFLDQTNSEKYLIRHRMESGDMIAFSNRRVLHGREKFSSPDVTDPNEVIRQLEGAYLRFQDVVSRFRVLGKKMDKF